LGGNTTNQAVGSSNFFGRANFQIKNKRLQHLPQPPFASTTPVRDFCGSFPRTPGWQSGSPARLPSSGLRHAYAQNRYEELTGWKCPAVGGPESRLLTPEQRKIDREVRLIISQEPGHERGAVTAAYLGR